MNVYRDIGQLPVFKNAVVTIGTFDGVHVGHQKIISQLRSAAEKVSGETVIITFHPHPRKVVSHASSNVQLITTIEERIELLSQQGIDNLVIVPFTQGFSTLEPKKYVEEFLIALFKPAVVIIGYDHKFGSERKGDYKLLEDYSARGFFRLKEIPQHLINHNTVSSTLIRKSITEGKIAEANRLLGYVFYFDGRVVQGDKRGRTIGFPTANLQIENSDKIRPANGVYAVDVNVSVTRYKGMMNIGVRPTVDGTLSTIEVHIFDFDSDIYGQTIRVFVKSFLREEKKFSSLDALKQQLAIDKERALNA